MSAHNDDIDAEFQSLVASLGSTPADYKDSVAADGSCQGGGPFGWLRRKQS